MKIIITILITSIAFQANAQCWQSVSAGDNHTVAIKTDGTLWAWGYNSNGQLGDLTNIDKNIQTQIGSATNWQSVSAGDNHTVAIKTDGTLWAWGYNSSGQLGNGTTLDKNTPTQIGSATNWQSLSTGVGHSITMAIKTDGSLWAWGNNSSGQLGDGTYFDKNTPTQIGNAANWKSISTGEYHTVGIKTDGTLWSWGENYVGQLGNGTYTYKNTPTQIGNAANWKSISAGSAHTVAIKTDGSLWAWGYNYSGQLGDWTNIDRNTPSSPGFGASGIISVEAGGSHTVVIETCGGGCLFTWGSNSWGQLGDGTTLFTSNNIPSQIGSSKNWKSISAGSAHTVAIKSDGTLWVWGKNDYGQLGDATTTTKVSPTLVGCSSVLSTNIINEANFSVCPNPVNNQMHINVAADLIGTSYTLYNIIGQMISMDHIKSLDNVIDLSDLSAGIYLLCIGKENKQTIKIIKE